MSKILSFFLDIQSCLHNFEFFAKNRLEFFWSRPWVFWKRAKNSPDLPPLMPRDDHSLSLSLGFVSPDSILDALDAEDSMPMSALTALSHLQASLHVFFLTFLTFLTFLKSVEKSQKRRKTNPWRRFCFDSKIKMANPEKTGGGKISKSRIQCLLNLATYLIATSCLRASPNAKWYIVTYDNWQYSHVNSHE